MRMNRQLDARALAPRLRSRQWYRIAAAADGVPEIFIYDEIGFLGVEAEGFVRDLGAIEASTIRLRINSPGGSVFDATAIAGAIKRHPATVEAHIDGLAASAASVIAMAGDTIIMAEGAFLMIHDPWMVAIGDAEDLRQAAGTLDKIQASLVRTYADRTGLTDAKIADMMAAETWIDAAEAVSLGFADSVAEQPAIAAAFDLQLFQNVPAALNKAPDQIEFKSPRELESHLRDAGGISRAAAKAIAAGGFKALRDPRDVDGEVLSEIAALLERNCGILNKQIGHGK